MPLRGLARTKRWSYRLEVKNNMERFTIEIRVDGDYVAVECSGNTPCLLADKIRELARDYFKEDEED